MFSGETSGGDEYYKNKTKLIAGIGPILDRNLSVRRRANKRTNKMWRSLTINDQNGIKKRKYSIKYTSSREPEAAT